MTKKITKVVFPVAGLATRFLPATKVVPKAMLPIVDRPLIQYAVQEPREAGITDFIIVTGASNRPLLQAHFSDHYALNAAFCERSKNTALQLLSATLIHPDTLHFCPQPHTFARFTAVAHGAGRIEEYFFGFAKIAKPRRHRKVDVVIVARDHQRDVL